MVTSPILLLTLVPGPSATSEPLSIWCVVCGWRGASDAVLNVLLFVPLGFVLGSLRLRILQALGVGLLLSVGIECAQTLIPFRHPGLGDVIYNALGCGAGALLYGIRSPVFGPDRSVGSRLTTAWAALGVLGLCLQGWLLVPSIPARRQWLGWTPVTPDAPAYPGRLLAVVADGLEVGSPRDDYLHALRPGDPRLEAFRSGQLDLVLVADTLPRWLVPLVTLKDDDGRETFFIGVHGADLVVRYRTRGMVARVGRPYPRGRGEAAWAPGDTVRLRVRPGRRLTARTIVGTPRVGAEPVRLAVPAGRGWGFLMFPATLPPVGRGVADLLWMLLLACPLGYWGPRRRALAASGAWIVTLLGAPVVSPLLASSWWGAAGVLPGILLGRFGRYVRDEPLPFMFWRPLSISLDELTGRGLAGEPRSDPGGPPP